MLKLSRLFSAMQPTVFLGSEAIVIGFVVFGIVLFQFVVQFVPVGVLLLLL